MNVLWGAMIVMIMRLAPIPLVPTRVNVRKVSPEME
jgi:hypothetical protein